MHPGLPLVPTHSYLTWLPRRGLSPFLPQIAQVHIPSARYVFLTPVAHKPEVNGKEWLPVALHPPEQRQSHYARRSRTTHSRPPSPARPLHPVQDSDIPQP